MSSSTQQIQHVETHAETEELPTTEEFIDIISELITNEETIWVYEEEEKKFETVEDILNYIYEYENPVSPEEEADFIFNYLQHHQQRRNYGGITDNKENMIPPSSNLPSYYVNHDRIFITQI